MKTPAILVSQVSKQYQIGHLHQGATLRDLLAHIFTAPWRRKRVTRETIWALHDISFKVAGGEIIGIIGPNGAGKSTVLKLLARITHPTSGALRMSGRVASLLEVGTGFHEELSGRENIYLNGSILGMRRQEINQRLDQIIEFSGVENFIDTPIKRYSSGMKLRLGFSVAAHLDADILLVDEVLAVGDAEFQKKCLSKMGEIRRSGRTVVFVSHDMGAIQSLCPRTLWIDHGHLQMDGQTDQVVRDYLASFGSRDVSNADLSTIVERRGNGDIRYTRIEFLTPQRDPKPLVCCGDALVVRMYFAATVAVLTPHFGFEIRSELGVLVNEVSTWSTGYEIPRVESGEGWIDLTIDTLFLMPGRYHITLWSASVGKKDYDVVENCVSLDVQVADVYGSGKGLDRKFGLVYFPCSWQFNG